MALKQCSECGHGMSSKAAACPSCGKKNSLGTGAGCLIIIGLLIFLMMTFSACPSGGNTSDRNSGTGKYQTSNSSWDSSVPCVEKYLKNTLNDPDSYKSYKWSKVKKNADGTYKVAHEYGAKNGFGGMVREAKWFTYDSKGKILSVTPANFND